MLSRARNETHIDESGEKTSRPYEGVISDDNPTGCPALATLLHLLDLIRAYPHYVAYSERQLIEAYRKRGIELVNWRLPL